MIRRAEMRDMRACLDMGREFVAVNGAADLLPFREIDAHHLLEGLIAGKGGVLLVADDVGVLSGMVGAALSRCHWNRTRLVATELFWFVAPQRRTGVGRALMQALEDWAKAEGVHALGVMSLESQRPDAVGEVYKRRGYRLIEHAYVKGFDK